jgi:nucleoside-diphosphate-sugar epimerase
MPTALVTGATGLVGSHIVDRLLTNGWAVRALVRQPSTARAAADVEQVPGDILNEDSFRSAARRCDTIFHTAAAVTASGGWEAFRRPNVEGTRNAIAAAESSGARLLQLSSVAVYHARYADPRRKVDEDTPLGPLPERAYYARSKRESEALVLEACAAGRIWATAVRPDVIYGRRDRQFVPRIARFLSTGFAPVIGGGHSTLAIVHAANVAHGAVLAATHDGARGRAYNLANDFDVSVRDFYRLAAEGLGRRIRLVPVPYGIARTAFAALLAAAKLATGGRASVINADSISMVTRDNPFTSERARRELGWSPGVRPEQGVPDAFRWWRDQRSRGGASS